MTETPAGWYPDPSGTPGTRFWDGQAWTDNTQTAAPPPGAPAPPPAKKKGGKCKWVAFGIIALIVIGAAAGGSSQDNGSGDKASSNSSGSKAGKEKDKAKACGTTASDDCTPRMGPNGSVRVDALVWRLSSVSTAAQLGDTTYGLGAKADGVFVVAKLRVHSDKDESVTLTDNAIKLEINGNTYYDPDNDGTFAAIGDGQEPFLLETLGPDSDKSGTVVFDIPKSKLSDKLELRFGELGFGETHGYIRLPAL